ncbi:zf-HC2 domain-containing protein [candidate division WOR-3 bacterium]|nr:zf-HC2 domain-containing protein [candidate division WOR-3 bacterium]
MSECRGFRKLIVRYFSKDLSNDEEKLLREHLAKCSTCKQEFVLQQEIETMLVHRPLVEAPAGIVERVLSLIPEQEAVYAQPFLNWRPVVAAAFGAVAWVVVAIILYFNPQPVMFSSWVDRLTMALNHFSFDIRNPFIMWGTVAYSVLFSISSLLINRRLRLTFAKGFGALCRVI